MEIVLTASQKFILAASGAVAVGFVVLVALLGQSWVRLSTQFEGDGMGSSAVVQAALSLQARLWGPRSTIYDMQDPLMKRVMGYWKTSCSDGKGGLCLIAQSGNLQCVSFVAAAYWLAGDPLPALENAQDFWRTYANRAGWERIPSPSSFPGAPFLAPLPGDLMVWKGGGYQAGQWYEYGHIAIVVSYRPPHDGHHGTMAPWRLLKPMPPATGIQTCTHQVTPIRWWCILTAELTPGELQPMPAVTAFWDFYVI